MTGTRTETVVRNYDTAGVLTSTTMTIVEVHRPDETEVGTGLYL